MVNKVLNMDRSLTQAIVFSVVAHLVLVIVLLLFRKDAAQKLELQHAKIEASKEKKPAVQSYLFVPTPKVSPISPEQVQQPHQRPEVATPAPQPEKKESVKQAIDDTTPVLPLTTGKQTENKELTQPPIAQVEKTTKNPSENSTQPKAVSRTSAMSQLSQLRSKINRQHQQQAFEHYSRQRSLSGMSDNPESVPHSVVPLTRDEEKEQNTTHYSADKAITKHDNGTCSITEDLSSVGMEGHKATSMFDCGESAFDKSFRQHMDKVKKKLKGPIQQ